MQRGIYKGSKLPAGATARAHFHSLCELFCSAWCIGRIPAVHDIKLTYHCSSYVTITSWTILIERLWPGCTTLPHDVVALLWTRRSCYHLRNGSTRFEPSVLLNSSFKSPWLRIPADRRVFVLQQLVVVNSLSIFKFSLKVAISPLHTQRSQSEDEKLQKRKAMVEKLYFDKLSDKDPWISANMLKSKPWRDWISDNVNNHINVRNLNPDRLLASFLLNSFWPEVLDAWTARYASLTSARCRTCAPILSRCSPPPGGRSSNK